MAFQAHWLHGLDTFDNGIEQGSGLRFFVVFVAVVVAVVDVGGFTMRLLCANYAPSGVTMRLLCANYARCFFFNAIWSFYYAPLGFSDAPTMRELCARICFNAFSRSTIRRAGFTMRVLCANYARGIFINEYFSIRHSSAAHIYIMISSICL